MTGNVVSISTAKREEAKARTVSGETVTASDCEAILARKLGHEFKLSVSDTDFRVTLIYPGELPKSKLDAFIVVNDGRYPFLLGYVRGSFGVDLKQNCYINPLLEKDLRHINQVEVIEITEGQQRNYQVALLHSFE